MTSSTHDDTDPQTSTGRSGTGDSDERPTDGDVSPDSTSEGGPPTEDATDHEADPIIDAQQQIDELNDRWLRAKAELENARRRARIDTDDARRFGTRELLREMLPVLDALQRALASCPEGEVGTLVEGIQLTEQQFLHVLQRHGITPVEARPGTPLDPALHRALVEQPSDEHPPGTIVAEITRGYRLHDRLLREAEVVVARRPENAPADQADDAS